MVGPNTQIYLEQLVPFIAKVSTGGTVYPRVTITDPNGVVSQVDLTIWQNDTANVVDPLVYTGTFSSYTTGIHYYKIDIFSDANYNTTVNERLCSECNVGSFNVILNPLDEVVMQHQGVGTLGDYVRKILDYLLLFENPGDGSCPLLVKVSDGHGVAVRIRRQSDNVEVARDVLGSKGEATFYLNTGVYIVEYFAPCGKELSKKYEIVRVDCAGNGSPC